MTFLRRAARSLAIAWQGMLWKRQKRAPRSILRMQEDLQRERKRHGRPQKILDAIKAERHALLRKELRKGLTQ